MATATVHRGDTARAGGDRSSARAGREASEELGGEGEALLRSGPNGVAVRSLQAIAADSPQDRGGSALASMIQRSAQVQRSVGLQRLAAGSVSEAQVQERASAGVRGPGGPLPHLRTIQRAFGPYEVGGVQAYSGSAAQRASRSIGAQAYATQGRVAFASATPSLHTAAHEAAHIVQQRAGVQLEGGVGSEGDPHEHHADAVADAVVRGESAVPLLDRYGERGRGQTWQPQPQTQAQVQRKMGLEFELLTGFGKGQMLEVDVTGRERKVIKPLNGKKEEVDTSNRPELSKEELDKERTNTPNSGRMFHWREKFEGYDWVGTSVRGTRSHGRLLYLPEEGGYHVELDGDHIEFITSAVNETETGFARLLEITEAMYDKMREWHETRHVYFFPAEERMYAAYMYRWRAGGGVKAVPHATVGVDLKKMTKFLSTLAPRSDQEVGRKGLDKVGSMGFSRGGDDKGMLQAQAMQRMQPIYRALLEDDELLSTAKGYISLCLTDLACVYYVRRVKYAKDLLAVMQRTRLSDLFLTLSPKARRQVEWCLLSKDSPIRRMMLGKLGGEELATTATTIGEQLPVSMRALTVAQMLVMFARGMDPFVETSTARTQMSQLSMKTKTMVTAGKTWGEQFHISRPTDVGTGTDNPKDEQRTGAIVELRRPPLCKTKEDWLRIPTTLADTMRALGKDEGPKKKESKEELSLDAPVLEPRKGPEPKMRNIWKDLRLPEIPSTKPKRKHKKKKEDEKSDVSGPPKGPSKDGGHEEDNHGVQSGLQQRVNEVKELLAHSCPKRHHDIIIEAIGLDTIDVIGAGTVGVVCAAAIAAGMDSAERLRPLAAMARSNHQVWEFLEDLAIQGRIASAFEAVTQEDEFAMNGYRARVTDTLIDAYLADLPDRTAFLAEVEGEALARAMQVHAVVFTALEGHSRPFFYDEETGAYYREVGQTLADGNCLIHGYYQILENRNATPIEVRRARSILGAHINRGGLRIQIESYIAARLIGDPIAGFGARFRALVNRDPNIKALDQQRLKELDLEKSVVSEDVDIDVLYSIGMLSKKDESEKLAPKVESVGLGSGKHDGVLSKEIKGKKKEKKKLPNFDAPMGYQRIRQMRTYGVHQQNGGRNGFLVHVDDNHYIHVVLAGALDLVSESESSDEESSDEKKVGKPPKLPPKPKAPPKPKGVTFESPPKSKETGSKDKHGSSKPKHLRKHSRSKSKRKVPFHVRRQGTLARMNIEFGSRSRETQREVRNIVQGLAPTKVLGSHHDLDEFVVHWAHRVFKGEFGSISECEKEYFNGSKTDALILALKQAIRRARLKG
ncbi:hypothetical protein PPSIR1_27578 [Plesiocystis pacifica SIR-1]|uniref:eCIS core domain-containing protein n=1 Tax=Plesiocystis pacifica SIR-1 TaxID=391625 RepID=A6G4T0_9BACT|nr:DUF4157 domain-containing protein [Plesiocystis pacifica]EDM79200.1 hypothetical protein PPSIR1_27578 [Plesiocystis pacifica SIR-1]